MVEVVKRGKAQQPVSQSRAIEAARKPSVDLGRLSGPVGEIVGARSKCRNCGRPVHSPPTRLNEFCSVVCRERYPLDAVKIMGIDDLRQIAWRMDKPSTGARCDLEALAVELLSEHPEDVLNINDPRDAPWYVLTRRGAAKSGCDEGRVEPLGTKPQGLVLGAERAEALAHGIPLQPRLGWRGPRKLPGYKDRGGKE